jgi:queuine tRNA-ribosyltransferase
MTHPLHYDLIAKSSQSNARLGRVHTPHGSFDTPAFMPVGTQATVKGLLPELVSRTGAQIILSNTYHLMLRPGSQLVENMGGLHQWMRWNGPILTDSGGFQVFSLSQLNKITDDGVTFKSHIDGSMHHMTPEVSIQVQNQLGPDIMMAFDECPPAGEGVTREQIKCACQRSLNWLDRSIRAHKNPHTQALFPIVQGGTDLDLRAWSAAETVKFNQLGYAIGGVAVGEGFEEIKKVVEFTAPLLPWDKPRYLMGVGYERDILAAVRAGVDMFDCVLPTRNGRNASAFTPTGAIRLRNAKFAQDSSVIDPTCDCTACAGGFSRSYLRHLFSADEMLGPILVSLHNIRHFQRFMLDIRHAIADDSWSFLKSRWPVAFELPDLDPDKNPDETGRG